MAGKCSVIDSLKIVPATMRDYQMLGVFHYRGQVPGVHCAIFAIRDTHPVRGRFGDPVGVIMYTTAVPNLALRNIATGGRFCIGGMSGRMQLLNEQVRTVSRVIIDPRYRGLGLAGWLVAETMYLVDVPIIESLSVMGHVHPFFERAGMKAYRGSVPVRCVQLTEALGMVGVDERMLLEASATHRKIEQLDGSQQAFIEEQIGRFLQAYGKRRHMKPGVERTRYVLGKLTDRPVYYIKIKDE
jgi:hypothetical protein